MWWLWLVVVFGSFWGAYSAARTVRAAELLVSLLARGLKKVAASGTLRRIPGGRAIGIRAFDSSHAAIWRPSSPS
jgi:hypothetical protein